MSLDARASPQAATSHGGIGRSMAAVVFLAVVLRAVGYTGFFGSDEVTYTEQAFKLLDGDWSVDAYVGANRYGVNFPVALLAAVFGRNEFGAALYSVVTSVAEVALLTWLAYRMFGTRVAMIAGLLLASLPTHIHFAGRLMADAPLGLTLTAAFVLFYEGEVRRSALAYFWAGFGVGLSFWIKPPVTVFAAAVFLAYPLVARRLDPRWAWVVLGALVGIGLNCLALWLMSGNFWYVFDAIRERRSSGYLEAGVSGGEIATGADYYLKYLFVRIYHTGLLGFGVALGLYLAWRHRAALSGNAWHGLRFALFWSGGFLLILSLLPVSLRPLIFVPKQTNYLLIFVAPLCLIAGWGIAQLRARWAFVITLLCVAIGMFFALLLQGSVAVFTANSWATLRQVQQQPGATFYVMSNAQRAATFQSLIGSPDLRTQLRPIKDLLPPAAAAGVANPVQGERYAVVDEQSFTWDGSRPFSRPSEVPACWTETTVLRGNPRGPGVALLRLLAATPGVGASAAGAWLQKQSTPLPARVYRIPAGDC